MANVLQQNDVSHPEVDLAALNQAYREASAQELIQWGYETFG
jgi:hypothetical protein